MQDNCNDVAKKYIKTAKEGSSKEQKNADKQFLESEIIQQTQGAIAFFVENNFGPDAEKRQRDFRNWKNRVLDLIYMAKSFKKMNSIEQAIFELKTQIQMSMSEKNYELMVSQIFKLKQETHKIKQIKSIKDIE